jgi:hypothetical protein
VSSFRPPRRSGLRAPWVSGVLAVLVAAALAGAGAAAGAQESPDSATATTVADQPTDSSTDQSTDTSAVDDSTDTSAADDTTDTSAADSTDTTAADDTTDTTAADDQNADPNGNINNLPLNSGIQTGTVFNPTPYGEVPGNTPQVLIQRPGSGRIIPINREIQIRARFKNFTPGFFSDPKSEYGQGTQRLDANGNLEGHNHGCFQRVARDGSVPAETCDSFVVLSQDGTSDILTGIMPPLTRTGRYRLCVDAAAENHYPAARAFAQRGGPVDCVRVLAMNLGNRAAPQPATANQ